jgi:hypothetical protein
MCFFNSAEYASLEQNETFLTLKSRMWKKHSFQKLNSWRIDNGQDTPSSNTDGWLWTDTFVSSMQLNSLIWGSRAYLHLKHLSFRKYSFQKLTEFSKWNNVLHSHASSTDGFLWEILVILQLSWIGLCGANQVYVSLETPTLQEVFLSKHKSIITGKQNARCCSF